jgi:hypothetical protein
LTYLGVEVVKMTLVQRSFVEGVEIAGKLLAAVHIAAGS